MKLRLNVHKRSEVLDFAPVIDYEIPADVDTVRIKELTGDCTLNLIDRTGKDGDYLKVLVNSSAPWTLTIGGPQGAPGVLLFTGVACFYLIYHEGIGKYAATVTPS